MRASLDPRSPLLLLALASLSLSACGSPEADGDADADVDGDADADADADVDGDADADGDGDADADGETDADLDGDDDAGPDSDFGPPPDGFHFFLEMGNATMVGSPVAFAAAGFQPTAREDLEPDPDPILTLSLDGCAPTASLPTGLPACTTDAECAPEQRCLPTEHRDDGSGIPGTEDCVTPRELLDVGPFVMEGFPAGPMTFEFTESQSGAYMAPPGDGSIPADQLVASTTYSWSGEGDPLVGIGPFSGSVTTHPALALVEPTVVDLPMGIPGIVVAPSSPLRLVWEGAAGGELAIELSGNPTGAGAPHSCRVADDGEFVVPAEVVEAVGFGGLAFFNMVTFRRSARGTAEGAGLTSVDVEVIQSIVVSVARGTDG